MNFCSCGDPVTALPDAKDLDVLNSYIMKSYECQSQRYPAGAEREHDAVGLVGQLLDANSEPAPPNPVVRPRRIWPDRMEDGGASSWKTV